EVVGGRLELHDGTATGRRGAEVDADGVGVEAEGAGRSGVGAVRDLLLESRGETLRVEPGVVEHEVAHLAEAEVSELGGDARVALAADPEGADAVGRARLDEELGVEPVLRSKSGKAGGGGDELDV